MASLAVRATTSFDPVGSQEFFEACDQTCHSVGLDWLSSFSFQSEFNGSTTIHQVVVLQQVWKRLKDAELQTINQIMDATGLSFNSVCELLYDYGLPIATTAKTSNGESLLRY